MADLPFFRPRCNHVWDLSSDTVYLFPVLASMSDCTAGVSRMGDIHANQSGATTLSFDRRIRRSRHGLRSSGVQRLPRSPARGAFRLFIFFAILAAAMLMIDLTINY